MQGRRTFFSRLPFSYQNRFFFASLHLFINNYFIIIYILKAQFLQNFRSRRPCILITFFAGGRLRLFNDGVIKITLERFAVCVVTASRSLLCVFWFLCCCCLLDANNNQHKNHSLGEVLLCNNAIIIIIKYGFCVVVVCSMQTTINTKTTV